MESAIKKFADLAARNYQSEVGKVLNTNSTYHMQVIQKEFNF